MVARSLFAVRKIKGSRYRRFIFSAKSIPSLFPARFISSKSKSGLSVSSNSSASPWLGSIGKPKRSQPFNSYASSIYFLGIDTGFLNFRRIKVYFCVPWKKGSSTIKESDGSLPSKVSFNFSKHVYMFIERIFISSFGDRVDVNSPFGRLVILIYIIIPSAFGSVFINSLGDRVDISASL